MARQMRAIRTREALVESAAALFDRDGFDIASLATISARAGVSSGALNFHFPSKVELAEAVVEAAAERLVRIMRDREVPSLQTVIDASHELVRGLRADAVLRAGFALSGCRRARRRACAPEPADRPRTAAGHGPGASPAPDPAADSGPAPAPAPAADSDSDSGPGTDLRRLWCGWVESVVARAEREGQLAPDVTAEEVAETVVTVATGHTVLAHHDPRWLETAPLTRFWALLLPRVVGTGRAGLFVASGRRERELEPEPEPEPGWERGPEPEAPWRCGGRGVPVPVGGEV
ncbi:TetR/AcrR family transcriptional regulator [Streptomyces sp. NPDC048717]|uniref:TetR/AcrR family transcriptional regulator n=1 Tax=Streptomyces sp. NPDC048717 TaxID=3154928 RepID=UPI0034143F34